ncbi:hypothetical protein CEXT_233551 [Caerostris extrusa]|uniref:Uncharacterized protein n=1 Tax=Caerostris extrusa TaxID=172846 RepID=A0AAV4NKC2_CAEEX|nr:hypothetical protein CEXT_233551 [Caerostris extrusa]
MLISDCIRNHGGANWVLANRGNSPDIPMLEISTLMTHWRNEVLVNAFLHNVLIQKSFCSEYFSFRLVPF